MAQWFPAFFVSGSEFFPFFFKWKGLRRILVFFDNCLLLGTHILVFRQYCWVVQAWLKWAAVKFETSWRADLAPCHTKWGAPFTYHNTLWPGKAQKVLVNIRHVKDTRSKCLLKVQIRSQAQIQSLLSLTVSVAAVGPSIQWNTGTSFSKLYVCILSHPSFPLSVASSNHP